MLVKFREETWRQVDVSLFKKSDFMCHILEKKKFGGSDGKESTLAMQETQIQSLGQEDPLEKGMATHSSVLA